jgi:5-methyltetrahydropteroyltriglutamate--homocysteine methyltransferase
MKRSTDRILTTHIGSLPRPARLVELMQARLSGTSFDAKLYAAEVRKAVTDIVKKQAEIGIDIIDDGEQSKTGFVSYVNERLAGFEPMKRPASGSPFAGSREFLAFPEFYNAPANQGAAGSQVSTHWVCTGPVSYKGQQQLKTDLDNLKAAIEGQKIAEVFVPSASPASVEGWQENEFYKSGDEYLHAIADAMHEEYKAIVDAGFIVQIDDPWLVTHYVMQPAHSIADSRKWVMPRVEALNHALRGIPEEKIRHHTCYGINMGPRVHDMEMKDIVDIIVKIRAGAYSFEFGNPRHEHEWRVWEGVKLPAGKSLIPGVISHTTVLVEHPELIAERLLRFAKVVGRENVIAGADCGFGTQASATPEIHPTIVWAKLQALVEGAKLATKQLWGRA